MVILFGFCVDTAGYVALSLDPNVWSASVSVVLAHCGGSAIWVFSTTLLQLNTDDRFRGRVFAADLGFCMFTIAVGAYLAGRFVDWGVPARMVESAAGLLMLVPALGWAWMMRSWKETPERVTSAAKG